MEWVLLILLISEHSQAIDHVGGFKTQEACEAAIKNIPDTYVAWTGIHAVKAKCIKVN